MCVIGNCKVDYEKKGQEWGKILRSSTDDWNRNFGTILHWSPFESEEELLQQVIWCCKDFSLICPHYCSALHFASILTKEWHFLTRIIYEKKRISSFTSHDPPGLPILLRSFWFIAFLIVFEFGFDDWFNYIINLTRQTKFSASIMV